MRRAAIASILAIACVTGAAALEAKQGLVKVVVNELTGRLSEYRLVDVAKGRYESFLFDQDSRTTFASLNADGRVYKLGDASEFRISSATTDTGVKIEFRSSSFVVRELADFESSDGAALADGLRITFEIENISEHEAALGLRYLVDTWLGEKSGTHFVTDKRPRQATEALIATADADAWVETPGDLANFMIQLSGPGVDRPDKAILANWKRLSDAPWAFDVNPQRNFTLVPYSINDSAVALYWEPITVARGATRRVSFSMGNFNDKGYPAQTGETPTEQIFASTVLGAGTPDEATSMAADLVSVRDLITRIDRALASGAAISDDELATWRKILDRLEERMKGY